MSKEAMKLALEALDRHQSIVGLTNNKQDVEAIIALRKTLTAQPAQQQEPVAWQYNGILHEFDPSDWATGPVTPLYTSPPAQRKPLSVEQERKHFEYWYSTNAFDYESNPIGSRECGLQWQAWKARAAHNIKENT